jgi:hypothetical protein
MSVRQPENLSIAWATVAIAEVSDEFLKKLDKVIAALNLSGIDICNADESGHAMVSKGGKNMEPKGIRSRHEEEGRQK